MSATKKQKRKPFGTSAANALIPKKRSVHRSGYSKSGRVSLQHVPVKPKQRLHRNPSKYDGRRGASIDESKHNGRRREHLLAKKEIDPNAAKRRDSKTPKTSNRSTVGGAYNLKNDFDLCRPQEGQHPPKKEASRRSITKPDPSPTKLPDPSSSNTLPFKAKDPSEPTKHDGAVKRYGFVSASLKRLFPLKDAVKNRSSAVSGKSLKNDRHDDPNNTHTQGRDHLFPSKSTTENRFTSATNAKSLKNERPDNPNDMHPPGRKHSSSDMDTTCSTPEKDSPLIKSPLAKLDPVAKYVNEAVGLGKEIRKHAESDKENNPATKTRSASFENGASSNRLFSSNDLTKSRSSGRSSTKECPGNPKYSNQTRKYAQSDMDTVSTPEIDSPVIKSPLIQLDPIAKRIMEYTACQKSNGEEGRKLMGPDVEKPPAPIARPSSFENDIDPTSVLQQVIAQKEGETQGQPRSILNKVLNQARNGPTDNKRVLEAMFNSSNRMSNRRPKPTEAKVSSAETFVGSFIGGTLLQRSASLDESEVTTIYCQDDSSCASMTTRGDHVDATRGGVSPYGKAISRKTDPVFDIFRNKASSYAPNDASKSEPSCQELRRTATVETQTKIEQIPMMRYAQPASRQLPAGWKVRWSKTKQKPYYVHPDFGSTWHCPGLISNDGQAIQIIGLYDDQRVGDQKIFLGRSQVTSNLSQQPKKSIIGHACSIPESINASASCTAHSNYTAEKSFGSNYEKHSHSISKSAGTSQVVHSMHTVDSTSESNTEEHSFSMSKSVDASRVAAKSTYTTDTSFRSKIDDNPMHKSIDTNQGTDGGFKSEINGGESPMLESFDARHVAKPTSESACASRSSSLKSTIDADNEYTTVYTSRSENVKNVDCTKGAQSKETSSTEDSSKCLTQDFESNGFASTCEDFEVGDQGADENNKKNQNGRCMEYIALDHHRNSDSVEFNNHQGGSMDELDHDSREQLNDEKIDQPRLDTVEKIGQSVDDDGSSVLDSIARDQAEINSLVSDHVDVEALLRNGRKKNKSPLPTIKEFHDESVGCRSSEVSPDESSVDDELVTLEETKKEFRHRQNLISNRGGGDADKSTIDHNASIESDSDEGPVDNTLQHSNVEYGSDGDEQSLVFGNNDGANDDFDDDSGGKIESVGRQSRTRTKNERITGLKLKTGFKMDRKPSRSRCKKKIFPPGPLCSLQFLEEIENREFDTPLWRRMKRKRSTLASINRNKASKNKRRRRHP